jgi:uncharacterized protein (TIGR00369 family)
VPDSARTRELLHLFGDFAPIVRTFGMRLSYTDDDRAVVDLPYNPNLDHGQGGIHGGVYATLLDTAGWFTAAAAHPEGTWVATSELSLHLLKAVRQTGLRAEGFLLKSGARLNVAEMRLFDEGGELVAHATATFVVLPGVPTRP